MRPEVPVVEAEQVLRSKDARRPDCPRCVRSPLKMEDIQFSGHTRVHFAIEHDLVGRGSARVVSGFLLEEENLLLASVPATDQVTVEVVVSVVGLGKTIEDEVESDFDDVDKSITALS